MATTTSKLGLILPAGSDAVSVSQLNGNFQKIDEAVDTLTGSDAQTAKNAAQLGGKAPEYYLPAVNLLDNPDFAIAQAGYPVWDETNQVWTSGLHGTTVYAADRWGIGGQGSFTIANGVKTFSSLSGYAMLYQRLWKDGREKGKSYTLAIELADGSVVACSGVSPESDVESQTIVAAVSVGNNCSVIILKNTDGAFLVRVNALATGANISFKHLYMFEGIYTAETLPPFVPRPYAVELAECKKYFYRVKDAGGKWARFGVGIVNRQNTAAITIPIPSMRLAYPTLVYGGTFVLETYDGVDKPVTSILLSEAASTKDFITLLVGTSEDLGGAGQAVAFQSYINAESYIDFIADL